MLTSNENQPRDEITGQFVSKKYGDLIDDMKMWITKKGYLMIWFKGKNICLRNAYACFWCDIDFSKS